MSLVLLHGHINETIFCAICCCIKHKLILQCLVAGSKNEKELQKIFDNVHAELEKQYPGHILPKRELQWITMSAGGWVGSVCVMHATLTEYVAFFGSAVDTVGASGKLL
jgi:hypothetical protein